MARWLHEKRRKHALGFIASIEKLVLDAGHKAPARRPRAHSRLKGPARAGSGTRSKT